MSGWAIVAIPNDDEYVWRISSEKVPHLTLLYLGEQSSGPKAAHIQEYLEHVVKTTLRSFGLSVDRRGTLGDKNADVLFFDDRFSRNLIDARGHLLTDPLISECYKSTTQYPKWTPHLTLGYPDTPAKKDKRDDPRPITWVNFDRVALWTGDYTGPEFILPKGEDAMAYDSVAMSDEVDSFFAHYGIKGMKWGVRRSRAELARSRGSSKGEELSDDAKAARAAQEKARTSGTGALSNKEMQTLVNRLNLEQQYSRLNPSAVSRGKETSKKVITTVGTVNSVIALANSPAGKLVKGAFNKS